ncbi:MAG: 30S ribosomal protein S9 [Candidatus Aenigmarchaeota archaeon]|nr:30S ribosomal protein S9 [Candidatus Aenigmarchaeota archaeon]
MVKKKVVERPKLTLSIGKRKEAVARAKITPGTGKILINSRPFELFGNEFIQMRLREPLLLAEEFAKKVDIEVNVSGGGISGQVDAIRQAMARGLVGFYASEELKRKFLEYDRNLLIFDVRRCEPHHGSGRGASKRGSRRRKQKSKR